jgi:hypothetical protein
MARVGETLVFFPLSLPFAFPLFLCPCLLCEIMSVTNERNRSSTGLPLVPTCSLRRFLANPFQIFVWSSIDFIMCKSLAL